MRQPVGGPAFEFFLNCDVRHGRGGRGSVPVLFAGREPDDIARPELINRPSPILVSASESCKISPEFYYNNVRVWTGNPGLQTVSLISLY